MFNQIKDLAGGEVYLIISLFMFIVFFVVVGIYLLKLSKKHIDAMSQLPLKENQPAGYEEA
ncbi:cbb3-type cytochrome oxidase subunit 3 [Pedobacter sp. UYEF25]